MKKLFYLIFILLFTPSFIISGNLEIYFFDVEDGNACLLITPNNEAVVFDCDGAFAGYDDIISELTSKGITKLKHTVASHGDYDHYAGIDNILSSKDATNLNFHNSNTNSYNATYWSAVNFPASAGGHAVPTLGTNLDLGGGVTALCVAVDGYVYTVGGGPFCTTDNGQSIAFIVTYKGFDIWLGGDLTQNVENQIPASFLTNIDVYLSNHHGDNDGNSGSTDGNSAPFINTMKPELSIISSGHQYDNPDQLTIDTLVNAGSYIIQTCSNYNTNYPSSAIPLGYGFIVNPDGENNDGDIKIVTDGYTYTVTATNLAEGVAFATNLPVDNMIEGTNTPIISITYVTQTRDGSGIVVINYEGFDYQSRTNSYVSSECEYSTNGTIWYDMTPLNENNENFENSWKYFDFHWNATNDVAEIEDETVWVRLVVDNGISNSKPKTNGPFKVDLRAPADVSCSSPYNGEENVMIMPKLISAEASDISIIKYYFEISTVSNFSPVLESSGWIASEEWTLPIYLQFNTTYYWRVRAKDEYGNESGSSDASFITGAESYFEAISDNFITPADSDKYIKILRTSNVKIYNVNGQLVRSFDTSSGGDLIWYLKNENGKEVGTGIYYIVLDDGKGVTLKEKVIIVR